VCEYWQRMCLFPAGHVYGNMGMYCSPVSLFRYRFLEQQYCEVVH